MLEPLMGIQVLSKLGCNCRKSHTGKDGLEMCKLMCRDAMSALHTDQVQEESKVRCSKHWLAM